MSTKADGSWIRKKEKLKKVIRRIQARSTKADGTWIRRREKNKKINSSDPDTIDEDRCEADPKEKNKKDLTLR